MRLAIVGTGIAGLGAAHRLHPHFDLTVFEAADWIGGHTHTVDVPFETGPVAVDTGFIVYNESTYPLLTALFAELGVATEPSNMSFAVTGGDTEYEGSGRGLFTDPKALADLRHWTMIRDILRFNRLVRRAAITGIPADLTLSEFTEGLSDAFRRRYLLPMCAAIWSTPEADMADYPAHTLIRFFSNHGLIQIRNRPEWRTVTGGARTYVERLVEPFRTRVHTNSPVHELRRMPGGVDLVLDDRIERFDGVVLATHADASLKILNGSASAEEQDVLGRFGYSKNTAVLHSDPTFMPARQAAWASWNVEKGAPRSQPAVTYWMNRLQNLETPHPLFVTLNPTRSPRTVWGSWEYDHPMFDTAAIKAQSRLASLQGADRVWFAGAYFRYGFHEDGLMSGYSAADALMAAREEAST